MAIANYEQLIKNYVLMGDTKDRSYGDVSHYDALSITINLPNDKEFLGVMYDFKRPFIDVTTGLDELFTSIKERQDEVLEFVYVLYQPEKYSPERHAAVEALSKKVRGMPEEEIEKLSKEFFEKYDHISPEELSQKVGISDLTPQSLLDYVVENYQSIDHEIDNANFGQ